MAVLLDFVLKKYFNYFFHVKNKVSYRLLSLVSMLNVISNRELTLGLTTDRDVGRALDEGGQVLAAVLVGHWVRGLGSLLAGGRGS